MGCTLAWRLWFPLVRGSQAARRLERRPPRHEVCARLGAETRGQIRRQSRAGHPPRRLGRWRRRGVVIHGGEWHLGHQPVPWGECKLLPWLSSGCLLRRKTCQIVAASPYLPTQPNYNDDIPTRRYYELSAAVGCPSSGPVFDCLVATNFSVLQDVNYNFTNTHADVPYGNWWVDSSILFACSSLIRARGDTGLSYPSPTAPSSSIGRADSWPRRGSMARES